ncbi:hypothetical protein CTEN210_12995 [Chaetoceros tenuissimus]|uniref:Uncharacterized protein n=1 Tax=Chaetoceros tenuissimus TaxID=426638 RepID=A0AAD3D5P3_9STRA|nr:hypothetical protein CTEN210_12995 [Chaetoceros tenuissimus]
MKDNGKDKEEVQDSLPIEGTQEIESNDYLLSPKKSEPSLLTSIETENNDHLAQSSHDGYSAPENVNQTSDEHISPTGNEEEDHDKYESSFSNPQHSVLQTNCIEENERRSLFEAIGHNEHVVEDEEDEEDESRSTFLSCLQRHKVTLGLLCFVLLIGVLIGYAAGKVSRNLNRDILGSNSPSYMPITRPTQSLSSLPSIGISESPSEKTSTSPSFGPSSAPSYSSMSPSLTQSNLPTYHSSFQPSINTSSNPSSMPTSSSSNNPSSVPSYISVKASSMPSIEPSQTSFPSFSERPSSMPTWRPPNLIGEIISQTKWNDFAGTSISLSADGKTLAVGAHGQYQSFGKVYVYFYNGLTWQPKGNNIIGYKEINDNFGDSVSISAVGNTLAVSAPHRYWAAPGYVFVYIFDDFDWKLSHTSHGSKTTGISSYGFSVLLSNDGNVLAVAEPYTPAYEGTIGLIHVYHYNKFQWEQKGDTIYKFTRDDMRTDSKQSISLSPDGNTIAVGSPYNNGDVPESGQVHVFYFDGSQWQYKGNSINGEQERELFGLSVSLSFDGNVVAIGAQGFDFHEGRTYSNGRARVYEFDGLAWNPKGKENHKIDGINSHWKQNEIYWFVHVFSYNFSTSKWDLVELFDRDTWIESFSLSSDGKILAVGENTQGIGKAKVYQLQL